VKDKLFNLLAYFVYAFLYLPIVIMVVLSFDDSRFAVSWQGFTLRWYEALFSDELLQSALLNSLIVAIVAVTISTLMGTLAAVGLSRSHFTGKAAIAGLCTLPVIIPEIALAVSAITLFKLIGLDLSLVTIIIAHIVFCMAYVILTVMGRLQGLNPKLEEAALDLGASPTKAFIKITLPLLAPAIFAGALLAFVLSLDDFIITQFTAGVGATTLPLRIYSLVKFGVSPEINALCTLLMLVTGLVMFIAEKTRNTKQAEI
jgi:spermidine/putrescine transport system permease protein